MTVSVPLLGANDRLVTPDGRPTLPFQTDWQKLAEEVEAKLDQSQTSEFGRSLIDDIDAVTARTTLGLGTAATKNTGTSGDAVPLLNVANAWSAAQTLNNGAAAGATTAGVSQLFLGAASTGFRRQAIVTRHDSGTADGNAIDFYTWTGGAATDAPTTHVLALSSAGAAPISTTTASAANVHQASSGSVLLRSTSSLRYKDNVETLTDARADTLLQLRPVLYNSKAKADDAAWKYIGLIAEEVAAIEPRLVHWVPIPEDYTLTVDPVWPKLADGTQLVPDAVQYDRLPVFMLSILKRVRTLVTNHAQRIKSLEDRLAAAKIP